MDMTLDELIAIRKMQPVDIGLADSSELAAASKNSLFQKSTENGRQELPHADYIDLDCLSDDDNIVPCQETDIVNVTTQSNSSSNTIDLRDKITGNTSPVPQFNSQIWVRKKTGKNYNSKNWHRNKRFRNRYGNLYHNSPRNSSNEVRDLVIRVPSQDVNTQARHTSFRKEANNQEISLLDLSLSSQQEKPTEKLMDLFQLDDHARRVLMPMFAEKFMKFLEKNDSAVEHKPIYDMELQKEIHILQKKTVRYTHKGQIVTTDGPGINGCRITPTASKLSLNYRFT